MSVAEPPILDPATKLGELWPWISGLTVLAVAAMTGSLDAFGLTLGVLAAVQATIGGVRAEHAARRIEASTGRLEWSSQVARLSDMVVLLARIRILAGSKAATGTIFDLSFRLSDASMELARTMISVPRAVSELHVLMFPDSYEAPGGPERLVSKVTEALEEVELLVDAGQRRHRAV